MINTNVAKGEIREAFMALDMVKADNSLNGKIETLMKYENNSVLKTLLYYALNTFKQYYIKQIPNVEPAAKDIDPENYSEFITLLDRLNDRSVIDIKGHVGEFLKKCNKDEQAWYKRVLSRKLEIGITQKGVNKAYEDFIPVYDVMLAEKVEDVTLKDKRTIASLPDAFVLQYKIDGYRLNIHKYDDGSVIAKTRNGLPIGGYDLLEKEAKDYLPCGKVYDGEMVSPELFAWIEQNMLRDDGIKIADRSLFKEAVRKAFSKEIGKKGIFNIFDAVDMSEWDSQKANEGYDSRLRFLNEDVKDAIERNNAAQMMVVPTSRVFYKGSPDDLAEVVRIFHKFLSWGWEGLMIKAVDAPYEWKRGKSVLKLKLMDTADLVVLSVVEGTGAGEGAVGKLVCDYKGIKLNISTGKMTMADKIRYFNNPNEIIGKTIEVAYQAESIGKNGEPVLDFARYIKLRKDK